MSEVKSKLREEAHIWRSKLDDDTSPRLRAEFREWYEANPAHAEAYVQAKMLWEIAGRDDFASNTLGALNAMQAHKQDDTESLRRHEDQQSKELHAIEPYSVRSHWPRLTAAALALAACFVVAILAGIPSVLVPVTDVEPERFATANGETKVITLPDRTEITLGAASMIELRLSEDERRVSLTRGNAYFDVTSNAQRPFTVDAGLAEVLVTGTKFDVRRKSDRVAVAVGEGSVRLSSVDDTETASASAHTLSLVGGQAASVSDQGAFGEIAEVYPAELAAWRTGRLIYLDTPLSEVVADLNRHSSVPISVSPALGRRKISGTFDANKPDGVLRSIKDILSVEIVETKAGRVIISN